MKGALCILALLGAVALVALQAIEGDYTPEQSAKIFMGINLAAENCPGVSINDEKTIRLTRILENMDQETWLKYASEVQNDFSANHDLISFCTSARDPLTPMHEFINLK